MRWGVRAPDTAGLRGGLFLLFFHRDVRTQVPPHSLDRICQGLWRLYKIIFYTTRREQCPVREFLDALEDRVIAKILAYIKLLRQEGPNLRRPYADIVQGKIRELRIRFGTSQYRILYFFFVGDRIVLTHGFLKKTREVPQSEIERAERYMADLIKRYERGELTL